MIAIIGASQLEIEELLKKVETIENETVGFTKMHLCKMEPYQDPFLIIESGYGKSNIGTSLGIAFSRFHIHIMIGVGACRSIEKKTANVGISNEVISIDVDFTALGYEFGRLPVEKSAKVMSNAKLVELAKDKAKEETLSIGEGTFGSADQFISKQDSILSLKKQLGVQYLDFDSSAIGHFAFSFGIPFVVVKGISNCKRIKEKCLYFQDEKIAYQNANKVVLGVLRDLLDDSFLIQAECHCRCRKMSCKFDIEYFQVLNKEEIKEVIDLSKEVVVALSSGGIPYAIPMCFLYEIKEDSYIFRVFSLGFGRKIRCLKENQNISLLFTFSTVDKVMSVVAQGKANLAEGAYQYGCNEDVVMIQVQIEQIDGRGYFNC